MSRLFLRTYLALAAISLLAVLVTHAVIARQVRRTVDARVEELVERPVRAIRAQLEGERPGFRRGGPERDRIVHRLRREHDLPLDIAPIDGLPISAEERAQVEAQQVVTRRERGMRFTVVALDDELALVVGPLPERAPRWGLAIQLVTLFVLLAVLGAALFALQRPLERRIGAIADAARRFGAGDRGARAGVEGDDPVGALGAQFDAMAGEIAGLLERREELLRSVSHELRTPLARLTLLVDDAADAGSEAERERALGRMRVSMDDMRQLIDELLAFARLDARSASDATEELDVATAVRAALDAHGAEVALTGAAAARARGSAGAVTRAVGNLVGNALRHRRDALEVRVSNDEHHVYIDVDDDGPGVAATDRERIFEPFVRLGDAARRGSAGLGLAIARRAIEGCGGTVTCTTSPLGGARFRVALRRAPDTPTHGSDA